MAQVQTSAGGNASAIYPEWNRESVRELERGSIRVFMEHHREYLRGRILDFGAGKQPYRDLVAGEYVPYEAGDAWPDSQQFDGIICNQVMEYIEDPLETLHRLHYLIRPRGHLVMTYPTSWDEVETSDLWRFTKAGMELLLARAGFTVLKHERRAEINLNGFKFPLGYGVIAQAR